MERTLTLSFPGSNPGSPAKEILQKVSLFFCSHPREACVYGRSGGFCILGECGEAGEKKLANGLLIAFSGRFWGKIGK